MLPVRSLSQRPLIRASVGRQYSSAGALPPPAPKPVSQHIVIYKEFGRPFAKVFLMGLFSYQALYWTWMKMEKDEEKRMINAEIAVLEEEVVKLRAPATKIDNPGKSSCLTLFDGGVGPNFGQMPRKGEGG